MIAVAILAASAAFVVAADHALRAQWPITFRRGWARERASKFLRCTTRGGHRFRRLHLGGPFDSAGLVDARCERCGERWAIRATDPRLVSEDDA